MGPSRVVATGQVNEVDAANMKKKSPFIRIMHYFPRKGLFFTGLILNIVVGVCPIVMNIIMGGLTTLMTTSTNFADGVVDYVIYMAIYCACFIVLSYLRDIFAGLSGPWFLTDIRTALYKKLMAIDIKFFDRIPTGTLLNRFTSDCATLNEVYISKFFQTVSFIAQSIVGIIVALVYAWQATLAICIGFILSGVVFYVGELVIGKLWESFNKSTSDATTKAEQVISAFRTVKSFDNEMLEAEKHRKSLEEVNNVYKKTSLVTGVKDGLIVIIVNAMIIGFLYFASWIILKRESWGMENGDLFLVVGCIIFTTIGIQQALTLFDDFLKASVSANMILDVLEAPIEVNQREGKVLDHPVKGKIEFKNVYFKYESSDQYALQNLSFTVQPGETVALVGESGCGKSTTLQLLQRFYDVESGEILIDDQNIYEWSPEYLRSQISIVPQSPVLFSMSIMDNIRYSKKDATEKQISDAAQIGNAHSFIMTLPENYKTVVDISSLSGGQKQRICISRAVLLNAPILLLDEATAALDTESERLVQESLEVARKGKTAITVAHRLATVINADRILVFKDGSIIESGKHQELLAKNGYYADLIKYQLQ